MSDSALNSPDVQDPQNKLLMSEPALNSPDAQDPQNKQRLQQQRLQSRPQQLPAAELWDGRPRRQGCSSAGGDLRAAGGQLNWTIAEHPSPSWGG